MASGPPVPHQQVEHTAAPTKPRRASKKTLANGEPSTHGERAVPIGPEDNLEVRVSCFADPLIDHAVTFETEAGVAIYQSVANRLRIRPAAQA